MNTTQAAQRLIDGGIIVFPTETVYGIGALASNDEAVRKIFRIKNRPPKNPLILHIAEKDQLDALVASVPKSAQLLMDAFWPGPLTICFKKSAAVSALVTAGLPTVCVRQPAHPVAHELLQKVGEAVAAPSANISGRPSTTRLKDAQSQLGQQDVFFLEGDDSALGLESTVVDCSSDQVRLLRPGSIGQEAIERVLGASVSQNSTPDRPESPGQLLSHYAPQGNLRVVIGSRSERRAWIQDHTDPTKTTYGLIGPSKPLSDTIHQHLSHDEKDLTAYAKHLYPFLNWCDRQHAKEIVIEFPGEDGDLSTALLNRLEKASGGNMIRLDSV